MRQRSLANFLPVCPGSKGNALAVNADSGPLVSQAPLDSPAGTLDFASSCLRGTHGTSVSPGGSVQCIAIAGAGDGQEAAMRITPAALCCAQRRSCSCQLDLLRVSKEEERTRLASGSQFPVDLARPKGHPKKAGCRQPVKMPADFQY